MRIALTIIVSWLLCGNGFADVLIFRGTQTNAYTGLTQPHTRIYRAYLIVDSETGETNLITSINLRGEKLVHFNVIANTSLVVIDSNEAHHTAIIQDTQGVYAWGPNSRITTGANKTVVFPATLSDRYNTLGHSSTTGAPYVLERSLKLACDRTATIQSNKNEETVTIAAQRILAAVKAQGFVEPL